MKRTGWIGILLLAWITMTAGAVQPLVSHAGELPADAADGSVFGLPGTFGDGDPAAGVDGDPDDVIGGNKGQPDDSDGDESVEKIGRNIWSIAEYLRHVTLIISRQL